MITTKTAALNAFPQLKKSGLPRMVSLGIEFLGTKEIVGRGSNATIMEWRDRLNLAGVSIRNFSNDDIAWCGLFVAWIALQRRRDFTEVVKDPLWARHWAKYGVKASVPSLGDVLVFERGNGGHVGLYIAEDSTHYYLLGGNQRNAVTIMKYAKARLLAARRPPYSSTPLTVVPVKIPKINLTTMQNEA